METNHEANRMETREKTSEKKLIQFSGIKPTGALTLGSYLGAIKNWKALTEQYESIFCVVDMHSITIRMDPAELRHNALEQLAYYIAAGLDPEKCTLFIQSHVAAHAELSWVLSCYTMFGELTRMTQFKDKSAKHADNINMGLLDYPVLMAADILLYQTDYVPVGIDQKQHLELSRDLAVRFNNLYSPTFTVPEGYIPKQGAKVFSLQDPTKKMSKSDPDVNATVSLIDSPDAIMRKFKRAVTDCDGFIAYDEKNKPGVSNLLTILEAVTGKSVENWVNELEGKGYAELKRITGEAVVEKLRPIQERYNQIIGDKAYIMEVAQKGALEAQKIARRTLSKVYKKVGLVEA